MAIAVRQKPKATPHRKKRDGQHQRRSHPFIKTYWPYIPLLIVVGVGLLLNNLWVNPQVLGYATSMSPGGLFTSTNSERAKNSLGALALNSYLTQAAQAKADDMVARNYWSHTTPDGKEPWYFITQTGYLYDTAGENLAYGFDTSAATVTGWMNSPGHRANILNTTYTEVGFGIANSPSYQGEGQQTIVVAMYAKPVGASVPTGTSSTPASPQKASQVPAPTTQPSPAPQTVPATSQPQPITTQTDQAGNVPVSAIVKGPTKVARVQLETSGSAPWSIYAVFGALALLLLIFMIRHSLAWHRYLRRGEDFVLHHKLLDIALVMLIMGGYILTRTVGFIQ
jgi:hypothetical protein